MSATVMSEAMVMPSAESQTVFASETEVEFAKCDCCGLTEECTQGYIERIRERFSGKWICGLCSEAVKDEIVRCERLISTEEALTRHINFCKKFSSAGPPANPAIHLISAMRQILRRSLDSRSMPGSPTIKNGGGIDLDIDRTVLSRSESCVASLSLVDSSSTTFCDVKELVD